MDEENYLAHYGILRKSGRYPWGSGDTQGQRNKSFLDYVDGLKKQGLSEVEIAAGQGLTTTELRAAKSIAKNEQKQARFNEAQRLRDKGMSPTEIGKKMGINESSVRALLAPGRRDTENILHTTSDMLRDQVATKKYIDIGTGVENSIGVSGTRLNNAVAILQEEGYKIQYLKIPQVGAAGNFTTMKVLTGPDVSYSELLKNKADVKQITDFSDDGGRSFFGLQTPLSIDSKRVAIRYADEGGATADGVIYVRPGVSDVSLGNSRYAQVRVAVDGTHYLKGMAMYKDDLPRGVDLMFNTNKSNSGNKLDALKEMKDDPDNPFGAVVRQIIKKDANGKDVVTSAMNIVNEEGNWDTWSKSLSTQMLSKQSPRLAISQLAMTYDSKVRDFNEIMSLTNPTVKKKLLEEFADGADSSAVHMKAASLPRQSNHVILPVNSLKDTEVYAPTFRNGESVVLIRHPHGGTFEIPQLVVNNKNPEAKKLLGSAPDAIGINSKVAERLSGADFDGDTVLVIPNGGGHVKTSPPLEGLKNFDPKASYPPYDGMRTIDGGHYVAATKKVDYGDKRPSGKNKQTQMGVASNLITDMTIHGASNEEMARAIRHSMVVIDSEKHVLDFKQSAIDNNIRQLQQKYQIDKTPDGSGKAGASTLISRAKSEERVLERKARPASQGGAIDKATGKKVFVNTGESYTDRNGNIVIKTTKSTKLAEAEDAHSLSSGSAIETVYANHSNRLKALGNQARKEMVNTKDNPYSPSAKKAYATEVQSLNAKLNIAIKNKPRERQAQLIANTVISAKRQSNPDMPPDELKRVKSQALAEARVRTKASKQDIIITDNEWAAIQAGAIAPSKLAEILRNSDTERVKELAMPRTAVLMSSAKTQRAKSMIASGYTQSEIADALGVSLTTLKTGLSE
jgi:DNA-binding CsgD family transcriptional regulator